MTGAELETPAGLTSLAVHDGYFAATLPGTTPSLTSLPSPGNAEVLGTDPQGNVVQVVDLDKLVAQATP
jgi:hypothetical protein